MRSPHEHSNDNPFTPTFGVTPPSLVGRDVELAAVRRALHRGPGDPARAVLLTGPRGSGKTVLLNALEDIAIDAGWTVVSEIVQPGLARELTDIVLPNLLPRDGDDSHITAVAAGALGFSASVTREIDDRPSPTKTLRQQLEHVASTLETTNGGIFISLDEVHHDEINELKPLFHAIQQCFRRGLPVAFAAAGLPSSISSLLNENVLTYLRRAERFVLGELSPSEVRAALQEPIVTAGRSIAPDALDFAVDAIGGGYPFLTQVVGFELWQADPTAPVIDLEAAQLATARAAETTRRLVIEPVLKDLSDKDRDFLDAMAGIAESPADLACIQERLGATRDHVKKYRARLIDTHIIEPAGRGKVDFVMPLFRDYLRAQSEA
ncbi:MAG: ATP-binding protein [Propionibacteriaceae bacterium]|nr:ATP-binding protein [Propionibacteriaceae bacterium]